MPSSVKADGCTRHTLSISRSIRTLTAGSSTDRYVACTPGAQPITLTECRMANASQELAAGGNDSQARPQHTRWHDTVQLMLWYSHCSQHSHHAARLLHLPLTATPLPCHAAYCGMSPLPYLSTTRHTHRPHKRTPNPWPPPPPRSFKPVQTRSNTSRFSLPATCSLPLTQRSSIQPVMSWYCTQGALTTGAARLL
jgi:hypothetical protein